jgi:hypothetical protein
VNIFRVFLPHFLGFLGAILWFWMIARYNRADAMLLAFVSSPLYLLLFVVFVGLTPSRWLRAEPTEDQNADIAVIFSFGYETDGKRMIPGKANLYLWDWIVNNRSLKMKTLLLQEGIWVATDEKTIENLGFERIRIHRHDPKIYVDTLNAAFCAIQQIQKLERKKILLLGHDLQLQRVAWDFERVGHAVCPDCIFLIPKIQAVPYPAKSVHFQTRNEFFYKVIELLIARPRDMMSPIPSDCMAPVDSHR